VSSTIDNENDIIRSCYNLIGKLNKVLSTFSELCMHFKFEVSSFNSFRDTQGVPNF